MKEPSARASATTALRQRPPRRRPSTSSPTLNFGITAASDACSSSWADTAFMSLSRSSSHEKSNGRLRILLADLWRSRPEPSAQLSRQEPSAKTVAMVASRHRFPTKPSTMWPTLKATEGSSLCNLDRAVTDVMYRTSAGGPSTAKCLATLPARAAPTMELCVTRAAPMRPSPSVAPAAARFVTHLGGAATPRRLQNSELKQQQFLRSRSYSLPRRWKAIDPISA
mmetsp:Transcript_117735/g.366810  ORF Transcript_117735/g.366810 Transcript_117735/m.366810 type:complete len:225 (+) Transcript_117735:533-1207(+)